MTEKFQISNEKLKIRNADSVFILHLKFEIRNFFS